MHRKDTISVPVAALAIVLTQLGAQPTRAADDSRHAWDSDLGVWFMTGTSGNNVCYGTTSRDSFDMRGESDVAWERGGGDVIDMGSGADKAHGEGGNDKVYGETGADYLYGGVDNDVLKSGNESRLHMGQGEGW